MKKLQRNIRKILPVWIRIISIERMLNFGRFFGSNRKRLLELSGLLVTLLHQRSFMLISKVAVFFGFLFFQVISSVFSASKPLCASLRQNCSPPKGRWSRRYNSLLFSCALRWFGNDEEPQRERDRQGERESREREREKGFMCVCVQLFEGVRRGSERE